MRPCRRTQNPFHQPRKPSTTRDEIGAADTLVLIKPTVRQDANPDQLPLRHEYDGLVSSFSMCQSPLPGRARKRCVPIRFPALLVLRVRVPHGAGRARPRLKPERWTFLADPESPGKGIARQFDKICDYSGRGATGWLRRKLADREALFRQCGNEITPSLTAIVPEISHNCLERPFRLRRLCYKIAQLAPTGRNSSGSSRAVCQRNPQ